MKLKLLPLLLLVFLTSLIRPANAANFVGLAKTLTRLGTVTPITAFTSGTPTLVSQLVAGSYAQFSGVGPGTGTLQTWVTPVTSGATYAGTWHVYSSPNGTDLYPVNDASLVKQNGASGAAVSGDYGIWSSSCPGGTAYVVFNALTGTAGPLVGNSNGPPVGSQPGQGAGSTTISDGGTSGANINTGGDANALYTATSSKSITLTLTGAQSSGAVMGTFPLVGYASYTVQVVSFGSGVAGVNSRWAGDGVTFSTSPVIGIPLNSAIAPNSGIITAGVIFGYSGNTGVAEILVSGAQTTGTTTVIVNLKSTPLPPITTFSSLLAGSANIGNVTLNAPTTGVSTYPTAVGSALVSGALTQIKASAAGWYGHDLTNPNTVTVYVCFFNAASITYGTTAPLVTVILNPIPTSTNPYGPTPPIDRTIPVAFSADLYYTVSTSLSTLTSPSSPVLGTVFYS